MNIRFALERTSETKLEALAGLIPVILFYGEVFILFHFTEWAWKYPALAIILVFPSFCLMTCRNIICSVAKVMPTIHNRIR